MSIENLSPISAGSLRHIINEAGLTLSSLGDVVAVDELQAALRLDHENGGIVIIGADGTPSPVDLKAHLAELSKSMPDHFRPVSKQTSTTSTSLSAPTGNLTERMRQIRATRETPVSKAMKAKAEAIQSNPWKSGNLTEQMFIQRWNPEQAERLKREASQ